MNFIIHHSTLIDELAQLIGKYNVYNMIFKDFYIDDYHPFCSKDPNELNDYSSRMKYMEEIKTMLFSPRLIGETYSVVHTNFILCEMEYLLRELKNKNYKYPHQYAYLANNHPWDSLIHEIMNE